MRKEICMDVRMAFHSGIGTYIRNVVRGLQAGPYRLRLIAHRTRVQEWPELESCECLFTSAPIYSMREQIVLPLMIPACDLFFSPHYPMPYLPIQARKRVVTIHDVYHLAFARQLALHKRYYARMMLNHAVRRADHIITVSQFSQEEIVRYTNADPRTITILPLGVDRTVFADQGDPILQQHVRTKYSLPQNYLICVGTLAPHKNMDRLMQAWARVRQRFPDWQLVCVGKYARNSITLRAQGMRVLDSVAIHELPALYQLAYAAIHPSLYEGFGLTPLEAMSCGTPAVVSKAASLPEVYGDSVYYIDPYDVRSIAAGMETVMQNQTVYADLKTKGLAKSREMSWQKTVDAHIQVFNSMLSG